MKFGRGGKQTFLLCLALFILVLVLYLPALQNDFVHYDDPLYVSGNSQVRNGLTWEGVRWALHSSVVANWHPITMLSHMLDCQLFGLDPRGHHATSMLLHALNAALLFFLLQRITGTTWRSFFVAALFAAHPLRVESVAWVSERKDVLSTFFGLLSLLAYAAYAKEKAESRKQKAETEKGHSVFSVQWPVAKWYALTALFFALGLMSKPMLVTWPCVMLLLDYWPLGRLGVGSAAQSSPSEAPAPSLDTRHLTPFFEKLPFFALTIAVSAVTFLVQREGGAVETIERLPLAMRIQNAFIAYVRYLEKFFWPDNLSVVYLYPAHWPFLKVFLCGALLAGISIMVFLLRRTRPYAVTGWLWFIGTLVPVIGLVQVGERLMADRYTYIPLIGIAIIVAWAVAELIQRLALSLSPSYGQRAGETRNGAALEASSPPPRRRSGERGLLFRNPVVVVTKLALTAAVVVPCFILTRLQISYWKDGETLFRHAIAATKDNYVAHLSVGLALAGKNKYPEAMTEYREALRLRPDYTRAHGHLAVALANVGRLNEAIPEFEKAVQLEPASSRAHYNLGGAYLNTRRLDEAIAQFQEALKLDPLYAEAHCNLGVAFILKRQVDDAILHFREALRLKPGYPDAQRNLERALSAKASSQKLP